MKNRRLTIYCVVVAMMTLILSSCDTPDPIVLKDANMIDLMELTVTSSPDDWPLSMEKQEIRREDARQSEGYLLLWQWIYTFEWDYYNRLKDRVPLDDPINQAEITQQDLLELEVEAKSYFDDTSDMTIGQISSNYKLCFNVKYKTGYLSNGKHTQTLDSMDIEAFISGNTLALDMDGVYDPGINLTYEGNPVEFSGSVTTSVPVYLNRVSTFSRDYKESDTLSLNKTDMISLTFEDQFFKPTNIMVDCFADPNVSSLEASEEAESVSLNYLVTSSTIDLQLPKVDGEYRYTIDFRYEDVEQESIGRLTFSVSVHSEPIFTMNATTYHPGDLVVIKADYLKDVPNYVVDTDIYNIGVSLLPDGESHYLLLPLMSRTSPGDYFVSLSKPGEADSLTTLNVKVVEKAFETQYLQTSSSTESVRNEAAYDQLNEAFARGRDDLNLSKLWEGPFVRPVEGGRISTEYGEIRYTNDNVVSSRHSGIDFALPLGTVVYATQNGVVTLAEELTITGNTLFIDHGFGLVSQCYHMNALYVEPGQEVNAGDPVGEVGSTGYSTGPHLHFAMYYSGVYLNPWNFFDAAPF